MHNSIFWNDKKIIHVYKRRLKLHLTIITVIRTLRVKYKYMKNTGKEVILYFKQYLIIQSITLIILICRIYQIQSSLRNFRTVSVPTGFFPSFSFSLAMPSFLAISLICGMYFLRFLKENFGGGLYTLGFIMVPNSLKFFLLTF